MRPLLTLAVILALSPAAFAASDPAAPADWRRSDVDERAKAALTGRGWRLENDGRALNPATKAPATQAALDQAVLDLRRGAERAALETLNLMLSSGKPLDVEDLRKIEILSSDLPPALAAALRDPKSDMNTARSLAAAGLSRAAAYFDGGRTPEERQAAAQPVSARTPRPRAELPYYTALEKSVGDKLRTEAETAIGRDPFGKTVLARLAGRNGKPDLPPIVIEDQNGPVAAQYDYRRQAVALDRESVLVSVVGTAPPTQAPALRAALSTRAALLAYLDSHPEAVAAVVKDHDVVLVHELTHAWQDRRDPIFREMARGNLPDVQPLEYEEEAYKTKNMYLGSKLKNAPASVKRDEELKDYVMMMHGLGSWRQELFNGLENASPSRALALRSARAVEAARLERVRERAASTAADRRAKALDLQALARGDRELAELEGAHAKRMAALDAALDRTRGESYKHLGNYYRVQALAAARAPDRAALLDQAERYAKASGDKTLIEDVRRAKETKG